MRMTVSCHWVTLTENEWEVQLWYYKVATRVAKSEVSVWSRIPNNTRGGSRIFLSDTDSVISIASFLHHTLKLGIPVEMVQFLMKLLLKQRILAMYYDFHCVLVATKFVTVKLHSLYVKESGVGNFGKVGVGSRIFYLRLRNPGYNFQKIHFVVCSRCIEHLRLIVVHTNTKTTKVNKMHIVWNFEVGFVQLSYDFRNLKVNVTFLNFNISTEV